MRSRRSTLTALTNKCQEGQSSTGSNYHHHQQQQYSSIHSTKLDLLRLLREQNKIIMSSRWLAILVATIYILSGSSQPLLMTLVKSAGLGDPTCQVYMLFYYIGPAMVIFSLCCFPSNNTAPDDDDNNNSNNWRSNTNNMIDISLILKASCIALIDIIAQSMNYTGSTMAGPTIFSIIYSSVTIWTAVYSYFFLSRKLSMLQWVGVIIVFCGLLITSFNSQSVGQHVFNGTILILIGSSLHALTYVLSEIIMTKQKLTLTLNCSIQGIVACTSYLTWQMIYTKNHYHDKIELPMIESGTTKKVALIILLSLSLSNLIHATSFFYTLKHFPGGSTAAGVMKGLQAVLVFVFSSLVYCTSSSERSEGGGIGEEKTFGGKEMCFTYVKFVSLVVVLTGVIVFAVATDGLVWNGNGRNNSTDSNTTSLQIRARKQGYQQIGNYNDDTTKDDQCDASFP